MTDLYRKKQGLEGLPVNSAEVVGFDAARVGSSDGVGLIVTWLVVAATLGLAIWGESVILGIVAGIGLAGVVFWTTTKWRGQRDARRVMRRFGTDEGSE